MCVQIPQGISLHWREVNLFLNIFKKLFDRKIWPYLEQRSITPGSVPDWQMLTDTLSRKFRKPWTIGKGVFVFQFWIGERHIMRDFSSPKVNNLLRLSCTLYGVYEWVRIPLGLSNAPASFKQFVETCLSGLPDEIFIPCRDDIFTSSFDKRYIEHLRKVFERFRPWCLVES